MYVTSVRVLYFDGHTFGTQGVFPCCLMFPSLRIIDIELPNEAVITVSINRPTAAVIDITRVIAEDYVFWYKPNWDQSGNGQSPNNDSSAIINEADKYKWTDNLFYINPETEAYARSILPKSWKGKLDVAAGGRAVTVEDLEKMKRHPGYAVNEILALQMDDTEAVPDTSTLDRTMELLSLSGYSPSRVTHAANRIRHVQLDVASLPIQPMRRYLASLPQHLDSRHSVVYMTGWPLDIAPKPTTAFSALVGCYRELGAFREINIECSLPTPADTEAMRIMTPVEWFETDPWTRQHRSKVTNINLCIHLPDTYDSWATAHNDFYYQTAHRWIYLFTQALMQIGGPSTELTMSVSKMPRSKADPSETTEEDDDSHVTLRGIEIPVSKPVDRQPSGWQREMEVLGTKVMKEAVEAILQRTRGDAPVGWRKMTSAGRQKRDLGQASQMAPRFADIKDLSGANGSGRR